MIRKIETKKKTRKRKAWHTKAQRKTQRHSKRHLVIQGRLQSVFSHASVPVFVCLTLGFFVFLSLSHCASGTERQFAGLFVCLCVFVCLTLCLSVCFLSLSQLACVTEFLCPYLYACLFVWLCGFFFITMQVWLSLCYHVTVHVMLCLIFLCLFRFVILYAFFVILPTNLCNWASVSLPLSPPLFV